MPLLSKRLLCGVVVAIAMAPVAEAVAQSPRKPASTVPRVVPIIADSGRGSCTACDSNSVRDVSPLQEGDPSPRGVQVSWTLLGALAGLVWYRTHLPQDGDFGFPFTVLYAVGLGAVIGTIVGLILE